MSMRYLEGVTTLRFYPERCVGCGRCMEVCPHAVFGWDKGFVVLQDPDACMECGACAQNCPVQAISVRAGVGCAYAVLASRWFKRKNSETSCCCEQPVLSRYRDSSSQNKQDSCCDPSALFRDKAPSSKEKQGTCCGGSCC